LKKSIAAKRFHRAEGIFVRNPHQVDYPGGNGMNQGACAIIDA
jgi:hypothetical protein